MHLVPFHLFIHLFVIFSSNIFLCIPIVVNPQPRANKSLEKLLQTKQGFKESLNTILNNPRFLGLKIEHYINAPICKILHYPIYKSMKSKFNEN